MKYCQYCGTQMDDAATACPQCYQPTAYSAPVQPNYYQQPYVKPETATLSTCAIVFAFLAPVVGLILGIIGMCTHKVEEFKKRSRLAVIFAGVMIVLSIVLSVIMFVVVFEAAKDIVTEIPYNDYINDEFPSFYEFQF